MSSRQLLLPPLSALALAGLTSCAEVSEPAGEWRHYGSDRASSKYAPLDQIDAENVHELQIAWRWASVDQPFLDADTSLWTWAYEATPLMIDGVLYTSTSLSQVAALDALTGATLWSFDPKTRTHGSPAGNGFMHRGVAYWEDGDDRRIIFGTGDAYLIALDAANGLPIADFGNDGRIDLTEGLRRQFDRALYAVASPPMICRDAIIVGARIGTVVPLAEVMPPGDVRAFDVRTGTLRWNFHSIPQAGEPGVETWEDDSWRNTGDTSVSTMMSCDEELGYVYLPFSTASNDLYGGARPGDNLYAESLVAVDVATGEKRWHFQMVHHGIWDYDLPAAPNLVGITVEGRRIKAVAQVSKQGFTYVFDRITGEPVWPIEERPLPQSTVAGERSSPTQPFPTKPPPFERQGMTADDVIDFTPVLREEALAILEGYDHGPLFTPPTETGTIGVPGLLGGANWSGAAVDPEAGILYVPSITQPFILALAEPIEPDLADAYAANIMPGPAGPQGLPLTAPPYGRITAIDLNTGEHIWMRPVGEGPEDHPALRELDLPPLGWPRRSFPLLTPTLLFVAQEGVHRIRGVSPRGNALELEIEKDDPALLALDLESGELIAKISLPGNATGAPMTYEAGGPAVHRNPDRRGVAACRARRAESAEINGPVAGPVAGWAGGRVG